MQPSFSESRTRIAESPDAGYTHENIVQKSCEPGEAIPMSDVLQSILESAGTRHLQDHGVREFLPVLLQQAATDLQLTGIALWTNRGNDAAILASMGDEKSR